MSYLLELQSDLIRDSLFLTEVFYTSRQQLANYISVDTGFVLRWNEDIGPMPNADSLFTFSNLLTIPRPYRPSTGSYNSIISVGQSTLIRNRTLLSEIKRLYEVEISSMIDFRQEIYAKGDRVRWERRYENRYGNFGQPPVINDQHLLADINAFYQSFNFYVWRLKFVSSQIKKLIDSIDKEFKENGR